jgi:hypothetical protein
MQIDTWLWREFPFNGFELHQEAVEYWGETKEKMIAYFRWREDVPEWIRSQRSLPMWDADDTGYILDNTNLAYDLVWDAFYDLVRRFPARCTFSSQDKEWIHRAKDYLDDVLDADTINYNAYLVCLYERRVAESWTELCRHIPSLQDYEFHEQELLRHLYQTEEGEE